MSTPFAFGDVLLLRVVANRTEVDDDESVPRVPSLRESCLPANGHSNPKHIC